MEDNTSSNPGLSWQEQRQEAIRRQQQRWQQLHPEAAQQQQAQQRPPQPTSAYPSIPAVHASGPLLHYPEVPAPSAPPLDAPAADWAAAATTAAEAERQRRQQQEEDDHRMAMELAEQFAAEDNAADAAPGPGPDPYDMNMNLGLGSDDINDEDWEQIAHTASMSRMAGSTGGTAGSGAAGGGTAAGTAPRPSSQAAAAAGSTAGGIIGAGLSALLAMAAQAAANRAQQAAADAEAVADGQGASGAHRQTSSASGSGAQHASATAGSAGAGSSSGSGSGSGSGGEGSTGVLGMAANALRSFLASRAAGQANSSAATGGRSGAAGDDGERRWENEQPGAEDLAMLQNLMQTLMGGSLPPGFEQHQTAGPAAAAAAGGGARASSGAAGGGSSGFRVTRLPGGGFTATYSSSSGGPGSGGVHVHTSTTHSSGAGGGMFPGMHGMGMDADNDMFGGPDDFLSQLLLAGARSARDNRGRAQGGQRAAGFTHYDPNSGTADFEPFGPGFGPGAAGQGLEALLSQIMGPGLFGGGGGGMTYEDLVGLDNVHVTTPEEVLSSLPQSKYVEGRKPGDSDTCVICQTAYSVGDDLTHLPCLHAFHTECITPWLQGHSRKCPVCKTDVC